MNFYQFHIGDYASATRHLSWLEDAAYRRLLDVYYVKECPLPSDYRAIYRLVCASSDEERNAVDSVLSEFFKMTENGWAHARCDAEIAVMQDKKNKASQSAQTRWRNAKNNDNALPAQNECNTDDMRTHQNNNANASETACEGNAPNTNTNTNTNKKPTREPDGFAEFWVAYPKKVGKGAAESAWRKLRPPVGVCIAAVESAKRSSQWLKDGGQFVPNPATWLNQRRWEDGESQSVAADPNEIITLPDGRTITRAQQEFLKRVMS
jgi:uncharacterized protein YdaU (DUF1376 family)